MAKASNKQNSSLSLTSKQQTMAPFSLLLLLLPLLAVSQPLNPEVLGLLLFKSSLLDPTSSLSSWSQDSDDPCAWAHIACHPNSRRVLSLSLSSLSLSGEINRGLLTLRSLQNLSLSDNNLTGFLNPSLAQLPDLRRLDLSSNALVGEIPADFFSQCRCLLSLSLANNRLYGEIPKSVGSCDSLAGLNLSSNRLSGSLPDEILSLTSLQSLDLSVNFLAGEIPAELGRLVSLRAVDLSRNLMTGDVPGSMQRLWMLSSLNLGSNSFTGGVPDWIGEMKWLSVLDLSANGFTGSVPDSIGKLKFLQRLNLSVNGLVGSLPESMRGCSSLTEADFSKNLLMGSLPSWVFDLGLGKILISGNKLSGNIQFPASQNQSLSELDLSANEFSGMIQMEIGRLERLEVLNLSSNMLSGPIPASLGWLKAVEVVDLGGNGLNGSIPSEIGGAVSLKELRLGNNFLSGVISSQIGNCTPLTSLILSHNNLTGTIPSSLANLDKLQAVDLSFNILNGSIPMNLSNLPHLLSFNVSHNRLSGPIPSGNFFNTIPLSSLSDNPGLCGSAVNRSCVLPKPIVLNPNSSSQDPHPSATLTSSNVRHKRIILSISAIVAIGAAVLIVLGIIAVTLLNIHARAHNSSPSAVALNLSGEYCSRSPASTDTNSGKLVMFSGGNPDFASGAHAILNKESELGRGGFGTVYKTVLGDGRPVAIKKLTVSSLVKSQEEFEREIKKLGKISHPNLVCLQGYYWTPSLQLLIYEFVSGESLHKALHESSAAESLSWNERFDVILGTARSLAHLHHHNVIHYNLKSSNVLIDGSGEPKVGDYGLARLLPMLDRYILSNKIQSALGYMAPEFACGAAKITEKCDVYGFGVLLLEVVTGRRPVEYTEDDVVVVCDVVRGLVEEGRAEDCVDGRLGGRFPVDEVVPVVKLGLICTSQVPSNRPEMGEVVKMLEMIRCPSQNELSSG